MSDQQPGNGESATDHDDEDPPTALSKAIGSLVPRNIGPALMGGRIADIAVHPEDPAVWYVAVGSGGVWKTVNAGTTWTPLFDRQHSYSIGCVTIDALRPETIWVGTGEAVSGRHVAWGDGVYRSLDGGATWSGMGLADSEHIAEILVDPDDSDIVYVAAEGPLWSSGGERGVYKSVDGGATWEPSLVIDDDTGVTSLVMAPDDPATLYAASYQRRRSVSSFVGGGPGSGIHVSIDGGETWTRITRGLPKSEMGRIGLAVTPAEPDLVYATIEAAEDKEAGFYRSSSRGMAWERRNGYLSGGTGPHYYQEIFASPVQADKVYQVDVFLHLTTDGGRTFENLEERCGQKHSDNHVVWIDPDGPLAGRHLLVGTDGGLYESFDEGWSWRHVPNLPISQFYRVAVDHSIPFTNVLGGAQDLGTLYGPIRTQHTDGVRNQDWSGPLGADGYHAVFDPDDHDLAYLTWQGGNVMRWNRRTNELTDIQPIPGPDDPAERWNWDTPVVLSPHHEGRVYLASQRVWRSDDRGHSWQPISGDLTTGANRYELPTGDRVWSVDSLYDHLAMSWFATITDLSESPLVDGLLYVGTDDGLLQVSEDGGATWRQAASPPDLPPGAFINDVEACRHRPDAVFVVADDHKHGDYDPYLYESTDRGRTWRAIRGDLPGDSILWSIEQDHERADLLFLGTERGLAVSLDGGDRWHRLGVPPADGGGDPPADQPRVPTIAFRDLAIQRRDDDLVGGSFGRGIWVLDDYSPLRHLIEEELEEPAVLFPVRDAWRYVPHQPMQAAGQPSQGSTAFRTPNPPFGAAFTYHLADEIATAKQQRRTAEKELGPDDDVAFPGWDALWEEHLEADPTVLLVVSDAEGIAVATVSAARTAGLHRSTWDLRLPAPDPIDLDEPGFQPPWAHQPRGPLAPAGSYQVELVRIGPDGREVLAGPQPFEVVATPESDHEAEVAAQADAFGRRTEQLARRVMGSVEQVGAVRNRIRHLRAALSATPGGAVELVGRLEDVHRRLETLSRELSWDPITGELADPAPPTLEALVGRVTWFDWDTTTPPTATQRAAVDRVADRFESLSDELAALVADVDALTTDLDTAGGPWTPR